MPKREDERRLTLSGKHPAYCTCSECTRQFLDRKNARGSLGIWKKWFGKRSGEEVKRHPQDCACATCNLLRSVGNLPPSLERKSGLFNRILGKK